MASYNDMIDANMKASPKAKAMPKQLRAIEHERSSNGGHVFTHRFVNSGPGYHEPETHTFGADEDDKALAHFAKHAGMSKVTGDEDGDNEKGEPKEHVARSKGVED